MWEMSGVPHVLEDISNIKLLIQEMRLTIVLAQVDDELIKAHEVLGREKNSVQMLINF